jgi:hypothetical protein
MILLDENIPESQRRQLKECRVRVQQIGPDIGQKGMKDRDQVIPLLHSLRQPVLFTCDLGLYKRRLVHERYGLVCLITSPDELAALIRRFLRHRAFNTKAKRMGKVAQASDTGIRFWQFGVDQEQRLDW